MTYHYSGPDPQRVCPCSEVTCACGHAGCEHGPDGCDACSCSRMSTQLTDRDIATIIEHDRTLVHDKGE